MYIHIAQQTSFYLESIFDDAEGDDHRMQSPEPYKDQLEFPKSPSPGDDDDCEPDGDDYGDDYEPDEDDDKVDEHGVDRDASATPPPNG